MKKVTNQTYGTIAEDVNLRQFIIDFMVNKEFDSKKIAGIIIPQHPTHICIFINNWHEEYYLDACTKDTAKVQSIKILSTDDFLKKVDEIVEKKRLEEEEFVSVEIGNYLVEFLDGYLKVGCQKIPYDVVEKIYRLVQKKKSMK